MVANIRRAFNAALAEHHDMSGRDLIPAEQAWLEKGLTITDQLDSETQRTDYVFPNITFAEHITFFLGGKEIQVLHPGNAHTAGDLILWLPQDHVVATGDIVTAPVPLMPSPYTRDYAAVLGRIKALEFAVLVPGHGPVMRDSRYLDLLADTSTRSTHK
ncbi:MAG TPA: MBL fold metallo-hydrolase [Rudaea sp.]|jgi:glyoxylase-like metal-dependent hydrolase (beta-lactamase superfamily II)